MKLIIASNNPHKIKEIKAVLPEGIVVTGMSDHGITDDIPEEEDSLEGNALQKARYIHRLTGGTVLADDTGLEVKALNNRPGVHSARYAGNEKSSSDNIRKLLAELSGSASRDARFRTVIALVTEGEEYLFEGIVAGTIALNASGEGGFGYDPVFIPSGFSSSFAEMSQEEKNLISHRTRAVEKLVRFLQDRNYNNL